jgi:hypothetical protein
MKGKGASLMASDFLASEWGCLKSEDRTEYVHIPFILEYCSKVLTIDLEGRLAFYSRPAKIVMDISIVMIS